MERKDNVDASHNMSLKLKLKVEQILSLSSKFELFTKTIYYTNKLYLLKILYL